MARVIKFSIPEHGWIDLQIGEGKDQVNYCFSDVGPDTIGEFVSAKESIEQANRISTIECYLEPSVARIEITPSAEEVTINVDLDDTHVKTFVFPRNEFCRILSGEIEKLIPLCCNPHWTHVNWC